MPVLVLQIHLPVAQEYANSLAVQSQSFQEVIIVRKGIASEYSPYSSFRFILSIYIPYSNAPKGSASHGGPRLVEIPQHDAKFKDSKSSLADFSFLAWFSDLQSKINSPQSGCTIRTVQRSAIFTKLLSKRIRFLHMKPIGMSQKIVLLG